MDEKLIQFLYRAIDENTEATPIKILAYFTRNVGENGELKAPLAILEEETGVKRQNVNRYLRRFKDQGIITVVRKENNFNVYKLNITA